MHLFNDTVAWGYWLTGCQEEFVVVVSPNFLSSTSNTFAASLRASLSYWSLQGKGRVWFKILEDQADIDSSYSNKGRVRLSSCRASVRDANFMASGLPSCFAFRCCIASNWHRSTCQEWQERGELRRRTVDDLSAKDVCITEHQQSNGFTACQAMLKPDVKVMDFCQRWNWMEMRKKPFLHRKDLLKYLP